MSLLLQSLLIIATSVLQISESAAEDIKSRALSVALDMATEVPLRFEEPLLFRSEGNDIRLLQTIIPDVIAGEVPPSPLPMTIISSVIIDISVKLERVISSTKRLCPLTYL